MIEACLVQVTVDQTKTILSAISLSFAVVAVIALRSFVLSHKAKIGLIYGHLTALVFPAVLFTTNMACGFFCLPCFEHPVGLALLALPTTLLLSAVAGFVIIPAIYIRRSAAVGRGPWTRFLRAHARKLGIRAPGLYVLDMAKPVAFSFRSLASAVFVSAGLLDVLRPKEVEAVLLHELHHLQARSSAFKLSAALLRFSPFSLLRNFSADLSADERAADEFVRRAQRTDWHLRAAKQKIEAYAALFTQRRQENLYMNPKRKTLFRRAPEH
ncbi:MAG: M48 family metalloprotease [Candidatus Aenigmarchaeota archaeon]|nr:M48 family metalloprotease [Candidatus Aenigmarchaeota archaeon]